MGSASSVDSGVFIGIDMRTIAGYIPSATFEDDNFDSIKLHFIDLAVLKKLSQIGEREAFVDLKSRSATQEHLPGDHDRYQQRDDRQNKQAHSPQHSDHVSDSLLLCQQYSAQNNRAGHRHENCTV